MREILFAGFGGQGVLTSGLIMADLAGYKKLQVTWSPSYGSAMRGGAANCTVKYGEGMVYNPTTEAPDLLLAMNGPTLKSCEALVKTGGIILVNSDAVQAKDVSRRDVTIYEVPCATLARDIGAPRNANIVMTGTIIKLLKDFTLEDGVSAMNAMFRKKGKDKFEKGNTQALEAGYAAV